MKIASSLKSLIKEYGASLKITDNENDAKIFLTTKAHYSRKPESLHKAQQMGIPVHVLRKNSKEQVKKFLEKYTPEIKKKSFWSHFRMLCPEKPQQFAEPNYHIHYLSLLLINLLHTLLLCRIQKMSVDYKNFLLE